MAINTRSAFIYGHTIDDNNQYINFMEDGINELAATIEIGSYTLDQFKDAVAKALNEIGDNTYIVSLDRVTRILTISADAVFSLLVTSGTQSSISAFGLMGYTSDKDLLLTYPGDESSGSIYYPQAPLYSYSPFENNESSIQEKVNESSSGEIEVVSYGTKNIMMCNIKYATDIVGQDQPTKGIKYIENNPNGLGDLRTFWQYLRLKRPIEFIADKLDNNIFIPCLLESAPGSSSGTAFEIKELYAQKLANYYETGIIKFRQLT